MKRIGTAASFVLAILSASWLVACVDGHFTGTGEGDWFGEKIRDAVARLRESDAAGLVFSYAPDSGVEQRYRIEIGQSVWCPPPEGIRERLRDAISTIPRNCSAHSGGLLVTVQRGRTGHSYYHKNFVAVPKPLAIEKNGQPTQVVLRKNGKVIELVEVR